VKKRHGSGLGAQDPGDRGGRSVSLPPFAPFSDGVLGTSSRRNLRGRPRSERPFGLAQPFRFMRYNAGLGATPRRCRRPPVCRAVLDGARRFRSRAGDRPPAFSSVSGKECRDEAQEKYLSSLVCRDDYLIVRVLLDEWSREWLLFYVQPPEDAPILCCPSPSIARRLGGRTGGSAWGSRAERLPSRGMCAFRRDPHGSACEGEALATLHGNTLDEMSRPAAESFRRSRGFAAQITTRPYVAVGPFVNGPARRNNGVSKLMSRSAKPTLTDSSGSASRRPTTCCPKARLRRETRPGAEEISWVSGHAACCRSSSRIPAGWGRAALRAVHPEQERVRDPGLAPDAALLRRRRCG